LSRCNESVVTSRVVMCRMHGAGSCSLTFSSQRGCPEVGDAAPSVAHASARQPRHHSRRLRGLPECLGHDNRTPIQQRPASALNLHAPSSAPHPTPSAWQIPTRCTRAMVRTPRFNFSASPTFQLLVNSRRMLWLLRAGQEPSAKRPYLPLHAMRTPPFPASLNVASICFPAHSMPLPVSRRAG
jgi:hypothetical protein